MLVYLADVIAITLEEHPEHLRSEHIMTIADEVEIHCVKGAEESPQSADAAIFVLYIGADKIHIL
jgi:hypothetical protein